MEVVWSGYYMCKCCGIMTLKEFWYNGGNNGYTRCKDGRSTFYH